VTDIHLNGFEIVEPRADALVESLRAFGYSPQAAVADLIDNSISADSSNIDVHFRWDGYNSSVAVLDDGDGMSEEVLREAMRAGSANPLDTRGTRDLGRFGLGLKTASFSQCRRLTVMSAVETGRPAARTWDLDLIGSTGQWRLLVEDSPEDARFWREINPVGRGTLVIWRHLDRLVDPKASANELAERHFYAVADRVVQHLSMIFHRFLRGPKRLSLRVNGRLLKPWDPFLEDSQATQTLGDEALTYRGHSIRVRSFVVPHITRLSQGEYRAAGGPRGWAAQQGFYIYRNRRLIVTGDWLGLGFARDEPTKLARIQLDLPNNMDQDWQLDVRKSVARPPAALAPQLRRIAEVARRGSAQVYRHRGKVVERSSGGDVTYVWEQTIRGGKIAYRINRQHPVVEALLRRPGDGSLIEALFRLVEETVPVPLIVLDHVSGESRLAAPFEGAEPDAISDVMQGLAKALQDNGLDPREVAERLSFMEPFSNHPELITEMLKREIS
jgi:Histidine kinase-, DNA gyrase B-, and HSP90-like ATPase